MLYLIAHKVRGSLAFDIAEQMSCSECLEQGCDECNQLGFWWIIPTSGHRAYPFWNISLDGLMHDTEESFNEIDPVRTLDMIPPVPPNLPDHYPTRAEPKTSLTALLSAAPVKIDRRF